MGISEKGIKNMRPKEPRPMLFPCITYSRVIPNMRLLKIGAKSITLVSCQTAKLALPILNSEYCNGFERDSYRLRLRKVIISLIPYHVIEWRALKFTRKNAIAASIRPDSVE